MYEMFKNAFLTIIDCTIAIDSQNGELGVFKVETSQYNAKAIQLLQ
jgi:hypothetical protein